VGVYVTHLELVSVIIPCYNAARWLGEAIESALAQTYKSVEVIVVDDGSTDSSLAIARSYGRHIRVEIGPNRGSSVARNRGLTLAQGEFIEFLDADDYLLPQKIERQVNYLESEGGDIVYGDWRHRFHLPDGSSKLGPPKTAGPHEDILEVMLGGWWVACLAPLHRREIVERVGGWPEHLHEMNDWAFLLQEVLSHADVRYQPGCDSVYRRHGAQTLSTANPEQSAKNALLVLGSAETELAAREELSPAYRAALAQSYYQLARGYYDSERNEYERLLTRARSLAPAFQPRETRLHAFVRRSLGFRAADRLAQYKRRVRGAIGGIRR
jgi:glycosyltransferase involved in cell wall biosynthesis